MSFIDSPAFQELKNCAICPASLYVLLGVVFTFILYKYFRGGWYHGKFPNLEGKTVVITGGNTGVGKATIIEFARHGCSIVIGARDRKKSEEAIKEIQKATKNSKIEFIPLDLADRDSIENFAKSISFDKIDYLINNAAVMAIPKLKKTKHGFEMQQGINHMGHFLLTYLLWDRLQKSEFFRVVNLSSIAAKLPAKFGQWELDLDLDNINFDKGGYSDYLAYGRSKMYNMLFTKALAEKISRGKGLAASCHPGAVRTELMRENAMSRIVFTKILAPIYYLMFKTPTQGAQTSLHCSFSDDIENGEYYADCAKSKMNSNVTKPNWDRLWRMSEEAWSITF